MNRNNRYLDDEDIENLKEIRRHLEITGVDFDCWLNSLNKVISPQAEKIAGKVCRKCNESKVLEAFYERKASRDGRDSYCKNCRSIMNSDRHYQRVEVDPEYHEQRKAYSRAYGVYYRKVKPEKAKPKSKRIKQEEEVTVTPITYAPGEKPKSFSGLQPRKARQPSGARRSDY